MTCHEFLSAIDPYLDDELSVMEALDMHKHLLGCELCRKVMESEATLHSLLRAEGVDDEAPSSLRTRILQQALARDTEVPQPRSRRFTQLQAWLAGAALVGLLLAVAVMLVGKRPADPAPLAAELAAKHLLYGGAPGTALEINTSEAAQLAGWLEQRLGFSARLPQLSRRDDRLVGGRVSSVADAPAAYLLYALRGRPVSLFVTQPTAFAKLGWTERIVDGVELYTASLGGIRLVWCEDEAEHRLYAAAATGGDEELLEFALLCARSGPAAKPGPRLLLETLPMV